MDAGHEDRWFKGIKSYMFSQAALSVTTYIRTIKVNVHGVRYQNNMIFLFFSNVLREPFTTILNYGATKSTSTFQEGRLGWTLTRPSYRLIGTHRLTRSVLE